MATVTKPDESFAVNVRVSRENETNFRDRPTGPVINIPEQDWGDKFANFLDRQCFNDRDESLAMLAALHAGLLTKSCSKNAMILYKIA